MSSMEAYLDDFGTVQVVVSRNFFNGTTGGFYMTAEDGSSSDCVIRGVEEHSREVRYSLTIAAEFRFGQSYVIHEQHGQSAPLQIRHIVRKPEFDRLYTYEGNDLGSTYSRFHTDFALWAPTATKVFVRLTDERHRTEVFTLNRSEKGVWRTRVKGDWKKATYVYVIERDGITVESPDPYALSSTANGEQSAVIDLSVLEQIKDPLVRLPLNSYADAVIYECSIRDMTSSMQTGSSTHGRFSSLCERGTSWKENPTGFNYLTSLGVTHVQFQPVGDFATVDERYPERSYNWGYDPAHLLCLEGSYSSDPDDPYARMKEFKKLVCKLHEKNIRVNCDVVFNHMYDVAKTAFDKVIPYYYFRYNENGRLSNGSWCGNDLDSVRPMTRRYFLHVIRTWMEVYGVDGFRFDLMGILDIDTMNEILETAKSIKPDAMIYGEGWNMPTFLDDKDKSMIFNQHRMPGIGHFNDTFRDVAKGRTADDCKYEKGYLTGNLEMAFDMCSALTGNTMSEPYYRRFDAPVQSINAIETHDNATAWDKMRSCCSEEPRDTRKKRQKLMIAATMLAQGVPFLHAGMEFCGTKQDNSNSYNAGDEINGMNWERMNLNKDVLTYTRRMIAFRRKWQAFRLTNGSDVAEKVRFTIVEGSMVYYDVDFEDKTLDSAGVRVIFNPSLEDRHCWFEHDWQIVCNADGLAEEEKIREAIVPACSCIVLSRTE